MELNKIHSAYFIGIGGIGMSAIARFFIQKNIRVSGYDKTTTPLTLALQKEGMHIHYSDDITLIEKETDIVIYTPAIPASHSELNWYKDNNYYVCKRSDVLQMISNEMQSICVAGTHGKTTMSTMIAHILRYTQYGCNAFLGGISANYNVNYWYSENNTAVIEADEYDRSFLKLNPFIGVISAMDPDHLDIYGTVEEMEKCYLQFAAKIQHALVYKHGLKHSSAFETKNKYTYSLQNNQANYYADSIVMKNGTYQFDFCKQEKVLTQVQLNIGGMHNIENCVAALAVCDILNIDMENCAHAMAAFKGVKRRFEYIILEPHLVYIDDYAHHPEELRMLIQSAKALFRDKKISIVFQPHLYTRTRDFANDFAQVLSLADEVILLDIYPARELPIDGIDSDWLLQKIYINNKHKLSKEAMLQWVQAAKPQVLITAGAGDIDVLVEPLKNILNKKHE